MEIRFDALWVPAGTAPSHHRYAGDQQAPQPGKVHLLELLSLNSWITHPDSPFRSDPGTGLAVYEQQQRAAGQQLPQATWLFVVVTVPRSGPDLGRCTVIRKLVLISAGQPCNMCPRGDLNTETGAISPDRGNHAIKVTRAGSARPPIRRRVRCAAGASVAVPASAKLYEPDAELAGRPRAARHAALACRLGGGVAGLASAGSEVIRRSRRRRCDAE